MFLYLHFPSVLFLLSCLNNTCLNFDFFLCFCVSYLLRSYSLTLPSVSFLLSYYYYLFRPYSVSTFGFPSLFYLLFPSHLHLIILIKFPSVPLSSLTPSSVLKQLIFFLDSPASYLLSSAVSLSSFIKSFSFSSGNS